MFKNIKKIEIGELIKPGYKIYAHAKEEDRESLAAHTKLVTGYFESIVETKGLENILSKMEELFFAKDEEKNLFREMLYHTMTFHDIGKINPNFQRVKMKNETGIKMGEVQNTDHSLLSAVLYINHFIMKIVGMEEKQRNKFYDFLFLNAYIISRHHTGNDSMKNFLDKFDVDGEGEKILSSWGILYNQIFMEKIIIRTEVIEKIESEIKKLINEESEEKFVFKYIYQRLILSLLFASDYYATMEYMDGIKTSYFGDLNDINDIYSTFEQGDIYKSIRAYQKNNYGKKQNFMEIQDINVMRTELFLDAETELLDNIDKNVFYLEAPTGSGKTNTAMNLSFQLLKNNRNLKRIIYIYPFNTLVEQNKDILEKIFSSNEEVIRQMAVINSITAIKIDKKEEIELASEDVQVKYYKKALINKQFLNYPIVLSTHVTLFRYLFGTRKEDIFSLHQLANSVIVLDEIQSYKNMIWEEIITFLNAHANALNIKIIIMSATLPDLNKLTRIESNIAYLIKDRGKYYSNKIFKGRVTANYDLLDANSDINEIFQHVKAQSKNKKKILIEFISKKDAEDFFDLLKDDEDIESVKLLFTGDDSLARRKIIIDTAKTEDDVILVATQVIEAGVDIDMDIGYKNISLLDNEEQFMGRINRSCKKEQGIVYFFKIKDVKDIYKGDIRNNSDMTLSNIKGRIRLENKTFNEYYEEILVPIKHRGNKLDNKNIAGFFKLEVGNKNYIAVENRMELIESVNEIGVFLNQEIQIDGKIMYGENVWKEYSQLLSDNKMHYAEKQIKLSRVMALFNNWVHKIRYSTKGNVNFCWNDRIGDLYYIHEGEKYMKNGRADREKIISGGDFI